MNYEQYAVLFGTKPQDERGGKLDAGPLASMVKQAMTCLKQGYVNVRIERTPPAPSLGAAEIREIVTRKDFPNSQSLTAESRAEGESAMGETKDCNRRLLN